MVGLNVPRSPALDGRAVKKSRENRSSASGMGHPLSVTRETQVDPRPPGHCSHGPRSAPQAPRPTPPSAGDGQKPMPVHLSSLVRAVSFSHFDRIWESEAPAEPLHFPQITDWLGRSLALPRKRNGPGPWFTGGCIQQFPLNLSCERKTICNMLFGNWLWQQTRLSHCTLSMLLVL